MESRKQQYLAEMQAKYVEELRAADELEREAAELNAQAEQKLAEARDRRDAADFLDRVVLADKDAKSVSAELPASPAAPAIAQSETAVPGDAAGQIGPAAASAATGQTAPAGTTDAVGQAGPTATTDAVGQTAPAGTTDAAGQTAPAGTADAAGQTAPDAAGDAAGQTGPNAAGDAVAQRRVGRPLGSKNRKNSQGQQPGTPQPTGRGRGRNRTATVVAAGPAAPGATSAPQDADLVAPAVFDTMPPGITDEMPSLYPAMIHEVIKAQNAGAASLSSTELGELLTKLDRWGQVSGRNLSHHRDKIPFMHFEKVNNQGHWSYTNTEYVQQCLAKLAAAKGADAGQPKDADQQNELYQAIITEIANATSEGKNLENDELASRLSALGKFGPVSGIVLSALIDKMPGVKIQDGKLYYVDHQAASQVAATAGA